MSIVARRLRSGLDGASALLIRILGRGSPGEQGRVSARGEEIPRRSALLLTAGLAAALTGYSLRGTVQSDQNADSLQSAVDACAPGDVLEISRAWKIDAPVVLGNPLIITSANDGRVLTLGDHHAFDVTSDNVWIKRLRIVGKGAHVAGVQAAIHAKGSFEHPLRRLRVENCFISGFSKYGIEGWHLHSFVVKNNHIESTAYCAVMILSGRNGLIERNSIHNVTQAKGFKNSYGIALTHDSASNAMVNPSSESVSVRHNRIDGVPQWEGIDTHGGRDILVEGNQVINCRVGIALVPGAVADGPARAPRDFHVLFNTVRSTVTDGTRLHGIQVAGVLQEGSDLSQVIEYATGRIEGNTIIGHGSATIANSGGVFLRTTEGVQVWRNRIVEPNPAAILCYHTNQGLSVRENTGVDVWSNTHPFTSMIRLAADNQSVTIGGNRLLRKARVALRVNTTGVASPSASRRGNITVDLGENNDFSGALFAVSPSKG